MPQDESVTYHVKVPTLQEVQAAVPFDIDANDPRTAAWYLLGIVYGRDDSQIWEGADAQRGANWTSLNVDCIHGSVIGALALSLSGDVVYGTEDYGLLQSLATLPADQMLAFLTAALLFQHISDGTWPPTQEIRRALEQECADRERTFFEDLGVQPGQAVRYDDSSPRVADV